MRWCVLWCFFVFLLVPHVFFFQGCNFQLFLPLNSWIFVWRPMETHLAGAKLGSTFSLCGADAHRRSKVVCDSRQLFEGYVSSIEGISFFLIEEFIQMNSISSSCCFFFNCEDEDDDMDVFVGRNGSSCFFLRGVKGLHGGWFICQHCHRCFYRKCWMGSSWFESRMYIWKFVPGTKWAPTGCKWGLRALGIGFTGVICHPTNTGVIHNPIYNKWQGPSPPVCSGHEMIACFLKLFTFRTDPFCPNLHTPFSLEWGIPFPLLNFDATASTAYRWFR